MATIEKKAVIIENDFQLKKFKKLCRMKSIGVAKPSADINSYPIWEMLMKTSCGIFAVPNSELESSTSKTSVIEMGFLPISLSQFSKLNNKW